MIETKPRFRWAATDGDRVEIKILTLAGVRQAAIARCLGIAPSCVSRVQRELGLPTHIVIPEEKILELFQAGWGGYRIARHLHVPVNQVFAVAHRNNFRRADKVGYPTDPAGEAAFVEAVKRREDCAKRLAKKYGIGIAKAQRLAHQVLKCERFRPGATKPPLSSDFPTRHYADDQHHPG